MLTAFLMSLLTPIAPVLPATSKVAQSASQRQIILERQEMRPLMGKLDDVPMFNSNSPEIVQTEGILLSAFPPEGMAHPKAHLNFPFEGRFDLFTHHISKAPPPVDLRTLYIGAIANLSRAWRSRHARYFAWSPSGYFPSSNCDTAKAKSDVDEYPDSC